MTKKRKKRINPNITIAIIGASATIIVALIGVLPDWVERQSTLTPAETIPATDPILYLTEPLATVQRTLLYEKFDDNRAKWNLEDTSDRNRSVYREIRNGKYYLMLETFANAVNGDYSTISIPGIFEKNFCLLFHARIIIPSDDSAIVVIVRATEYTPGSDQSYYRIDLHDNGSGYVKLDLPGSLSLKQVSSFQDGVFWSDGDVHAIKISFQEGEFQIYNVQSNMLLFEKNFVGNDLHALAGGIRLGIRVFGPDQNATAEFDSIYVYNKCQ